METLTAPDTHHNLLHLPSVLCFPHHFGSPAHSILGSTESDTEQHELIAGLTRQFNYHNIILNHEKLHGLSASPQSTLSGARCWSASGSPDGPSQSPSPPTTPYARKEDSWDLIYAAAGQLREKECAIPPRNFDPAYAKQVCKPTNTGVFLNQCFPHIPLSRTNQFQSSVWGREAKEVWPSHQQSHHQKSEIGKSGKQLGFTQSAWPPLQSHLQNPVPPVQGGFTMRSIPVGRSDPVMKKECAGTGVFLPRRSVNINDYRNKTAPNSTNKNLTPNIQNQTRGSKGLAPNYNAIMARRKELLAQQRRNIIQDNEIRLPQEWTY